MIYNESIAIDIIDEEDRLWREYRVRRGETGWAKGGKKDVAGGTGARVARRKGDFWREPITIRLGV